MASPQPDTYTAGTGQPITAGRYSNPVSVSFTSGVAAEQDLSAPFPAINGHEVSLAVTGGSLPSGITLDPIGKRLIYDGTPGVTSADLVVTATANAPSQVLANGSGTVPAMYAIVFPKGVVTGPLGASESGLHVVVRRTWNDGSVKHAIVCGVAPVNTTITYNTNWQGGTPLAHSDIVSAAPTASVVISGIGTVNLADLLASDPVKTHVSTPGMVECHYRSQVGSSDLYVTFHVRLFSNGDCWVRAMIDNPSMDRYRGNYYTYDVTVIIDGVTVAGRSGCPHPINSCWWAERWVGATQHDLVVRHDVEQIQQTGLVPQYGRSPQIQESVLANLQTTIPYVDHGSYTRKMGDGGYAAQLGLLPNWEGQYLVSGDDRAWRCVIAHMRAAFLYAYSWRVPSNGRVMNPSDNPIGNWSTLDGNNGNGGSYELWNNYGTDAFGPGNDSIETDYAHFPSCGYLNYIVTGDDLALDLLMGTNAAAYQSLPAGSVYGDGLNRINSGQTRATGWTIRSIGQACGIMPGDHTNLSPYKTWLSNHITYIKQYSLDDTTIDPTTAATGITQADSEIGMPWKGTNKISPNPLEITPWQYNFWVCSMGLVSDCEPLDDMTDFYDVRDWMYRFPVGLIGNQSGYCYGYADLNEITISSFVRPQGVRTDGNQFYRRWYDVYEATLGPGAPVCDMDNLVEARLATADTTNWGIALTALGYAIKHGAPGALTSLNHVEGADNYSIMEGASWDVNPVWAVRPISQPSKSIRSASLGIS